MRRATALPRLFRATIQTNGRLRMASLAAFAPARAQLLLPNQLLPLPFEPKDNKMYRGMVLAADRKDLRYILQNG